MYESNRCGKCKQIKSADQFHKSSKNQSGLQSLCKSCDRERKRQWQKDNPDKVKAYSKKYEDANREKRREKNRKWSKENSEYELRRHKEWAKNNPERVKERNKKNYDKHRDMYIYLANRRRATRLKSNTEYYAAKEVIQAYGSDCHICGKKIDLDAPRRPKFTGDVSFHMGLHLDHLVPLSRGGEDTIKNVRPAHAICNLQKGNRL